MSTHPRVIDEIFSDGYSRSMFSIAEAAEEFYLDRGNRSEAWFWCRYLRAPLVNAGSIVAPRLTI